MSSLLAPSESHAPLPNAIHTPSKALLRLHSFRHWGIRDKCDCWLLITENNWGGAILMRYLREGICSLFWWCGGVMVWWCDGVMVWWCDDVMVWWCGNVVEWWCDDVMVWWCDDVMVWCCDDVMVWWCDDVMTWWRDDVMMWWCMLITRWAYLNSRPLPNPSTPQARSFYGCTVLVAIGVLFVIKMRHWWLLRYCLLFKMRHWWLLGYCYWSIGWLLGNCLLLKWGIGGYWGIVCY